MKHLLPLMLAAFLASNVAATTQISWSDLSYFEGTVPTVGRPSVADLDGDGFDDLVFASTAGQEIFVAMGTGAGSFVAPVARVMVPFSELLGADPRGLTVAVGDIDGDGTLDLGIAQSYSIPFSDGTNFLWCAGDGTGKFGPLLDVGQHFGIVEDVELADLTGDGIVDFAAAARSSRSSFFLGLGNGSFGPRRTLVNDLVGATSLGVADFDGDGWLDLAASVVDSQSPLAFGTTVFFGRSGQPFSSIESVFLGSGSTDLRVADVDGDGAQDLVDFAAGELRTLRNLGSRLFGAPFTLAVPPTSDGLIDFHVLDIDADGRIDVVTGSTSGLAITSRNGPSQWSPLSTLNQQSTRYAMPVRSNADGLGDIFQVTGPTSQQAMISFTGTVNAAQQFRIENALRVDDDYRGTSIATIDVDQDGFRDLVTTGFAGLPASLRRSDGSISLAPPEALAISTPPFPLRAPLVADFNGDGHDDVVFSDGVTTEARITLADGLGGFEPDRLFFVSPGRLGRWDTGDLDNDGYADVVWSLAPGSSTGVHGTLAVFSGPGGVAGPIHPIPGTFFWQSRPNLIDVDEDGDLDVLVDQPGGLERSLLGPGRVFGDREVIQKYAGSVSHAYLHGDFDHDGVRDLAYLGGQRVRYLKGVGQGNFSGERTLTGSLGTGRGLMAVDLDLDGDLDFVAERLSLSEGYTPTYSLNLGPGAGYTFWTLLPTRTHGSDISVSQTQAVDLDGDQDLDLLLLIGRRRLAAIFNESLGAIGDSYCGPAVPNSTGVPAELNATGSTNLGLGRLTLNVRHVPPGSFGFFLVGQVQGNTATVPGSVGRLCLDAPIGRFVDPSELQLANASGTYKLLVDVSSIPTPAFGHVPIAPGETWNFQAWHRDTDASGLPTSNFTTAVSVGF